MSCERYRDALSDVAAGGAVPSPLETHMASCAACRDELAALRQGLALADVEMAGLLSAEPSADLAVRIRLAAAEGPAPAPWRFGWLWPAMAAAAVVAVALAAWPPHRPGVPAPPPLPRAADASPAPARPAPPTLPAPGPADDPVLPAPRRSPGPAPSGSTDPEVLVPPGEGEALLRLVALVHRDGVAPALLAAAGQESAEPTEPSPIEIAPLAIVPLDPAEIAGTD